jgi:MFS family permease
VFITIVGRVSDIFGRRWIFIGGQAFGLIGSIVGATAQNVSTLIGATSLIGIGASSALSYYFVLGELVPTKYRFMANSVVYIMEIGCLALAPVISNSFLIYHPSVSWRGNYYLLIAINAVALLFWVLFYHPPTFQMKHENESVGKYIKNFDYVGTVLYTVGAVRIPLIMRINHLAKYDL